MYHKYCARMIYAWGGSLGQQLRETKRGKVFLEEVEKISMEEVRRLIRRLIEAGYDRRVPTSQSTQQIHMKHESTVKNVMLAQDLKNELASGTIFLNGQSTCIRKLSRELKSLLTPICEAIDSHPVNQSRRATIIDPHIGTTTRGQLQSELNNLELRVSRIDVAGQNEQYEDMPQPLDSDEEAQLHAELDALVEMQERVEAMGGNQNKYMASVFQRACLQITDIEATYIVLANLFHAAAMSKELKTVPAITMKEFSTVLDKLNLSALSQSDVEDMFEQGLHYVPFRKLVKQTISEDQHTHISGVSPSGSEIFSYEDLSDEDARVLMTSVLVGSETFRERVMSIVTDTSFCYLADASSINHLSYANLKLLSFGGRKRTVAKGDVFLSESNVRSNSKLSASRSMVPGYQAQGITKDLEVQVTAAATTSTKSGLFSPVARSPNLSGPSSTPETWFLVISGSLVIDDDPLCLEQKLYSELGPGNIFGGYRALTGSRTPFTVRAVKGCELLELEVAHLLEFRSRESHEVIRFLASNMGEAPLSAAHHDPTANIKEHFEFEDDLHKFGPLPDTILQSLKISFSKIEQIWQEICLGEEVVPLSQFTAFQPYLGEVGSELFKKLFTAEWAPEQISKRVYWEIWINFLTLETYGKMSSATSENVDRINANQKSAPVVDADTSEESKHDCLELLHARFSRARHLGHKLFDCEILERYESSFVEVTGTIGNPLQASKVALFLEKLFPDFNYHISFYNCNEFLQTFGRDGLKTKQISFADIRKVLIERSKETRHNGLFIDSALNRNSNFYTHWINLMCIVACLQFVCVPVRLCFVPWKSMLDTRALALDLTLDFLTAAHVVVLSNTAYQNSRGHWITNRFKMLRKIKVFYLLAAVPVDWFAYVFGASFEMCNWLRLLKLLLPFEILVRERNPGLQISTLHRLLGLIIRSFGLLHVAACAWFYIGTRYKEWHPQAAVSWYEISPSLTSLSRISYQDRYGLRNGSTVWDQYLISQYWVTATLTSYGIVGDLLPQNSTEMIYAMVLMILSITVFGYIIGEVSSVFMIQDEEVTKARSQLGSVESFVRGSKLEDDLRDEIRTYFRATRMHSSSDQAAIFRRMSRSLQVEVSSYTTRGYLDGVPLFQGCSQQLIDAVSVLLSEVTFAPEDYLYRISEIAREMFFVIDGSVDEVTETEKGEKVEAVVKAGGAIGVLSFFFGMRHLASARAGKLSGAVCLRLSREDFMDMLKLYPEEEGKIAQSALHSFEGARSQYGSRRASSLAASTKTGESNALSSAVGASSNGRQVASDDNGADSSEALTQALGGSGIRQRMAVLKRRRENKRVYGILIAASKGDLQRLKSSLQTEGDCNISDHFRRTPLHVAAAQGQLEAVRMLLAARADLDARDRFENTPLNEAVRHRHDDVAMLIRERSPGMSISLKGHEIGGLMCQAAYKGDLEHVRRLITNRASPSACDYDRRSALHLACCKGHTEIVRCLLEANADLQARDRFGGAPLDDAVRHGHKHLQRILCAYGAKLVGETYAFKVCEAAANGELDTIETLVENGVDMAVGDYDGRTALHLAASEGQVSVLHYLLELEPPLDVNAVDRVGGTPLEDAMRHGHRVAEVMIEEAGGMRRHERRLSELVTRYLAHLEPNRIDVLLRARRTGAAVRIKELRAEAVQAAAKDCVEAKAVEVLRDVLIPELQKQLQKVYKLLAQLVSDFCQGSKILLTALKMRSNDLSLTRQAMLALRNSLLHSESGGTREIIPIDITNTFLAQLPELLAAVAAAREIIDRQLPKCGLVQMYAKGFRREAAALRVEVRQTADALLLVRRVMRGAQTVFRTRTFRNILHQLGSLDILGSSSTLDQHTALSGNISKTHFVLNDDQNIRDRLMNPKGSLSSTSRTSNQEIVEYVGTPEHVAHDITSRNSLVLDHLDGEQNIVDKGSADLVITETTRRITARLERRAPRRASLPTMERLSSNLTPPALLKTASGATAPVKSPALAHDGKPQQQQDSVIENQEGSEFTQVEGLQSAERQPDWQKRSRMGRPLRGRRGGMRIASSIDSH